jgi:cytochrome c-type biogenesis protein
LLLGKSYMLPMRVHPALKKHGFGSLYVLGVFSGIATSCCAPVLAGVMALSAMPGSWGLGVVYALAFVTGMVMPLFTVALFVDQARAAQKLQLFRRRVSYSVFGEQVTVSLSHLIAGLLYLTIGIVILVFERSGPESFGSGYQLQINMLTARVTQGIQHLTSVVPQAVWAVLFVGIFITIALAAYRQSKHIPTDKEDRT